MVMTQHPSKCTAGGIVPDYPDGGQSQCLGDPACLRIAFSIELESIFFELLMLCFVGSYALLTLLCVFGERGHFVLVFGVLQNRETVFATQLHSSSLSHCVLVDRHR